MLAVHGVLQRILEVQCTQYTKAFKVYNCTASGSADLSSVTVSPVSGGGGEAPAPPPVAWARGAPPSVVISVTAAISSATAVISAPAVISVSVTPFGPALPPGWASHVHPWGGGVRALCNREIYADFLSVQFCSVHLTFCLCGIVHV